MGQCYTVNIQIKCPDKQEWMNKLLSKTIAYLREPAKIPRNFLTIIKESKEPNTEAEKILSEILPDVNIEDTDDGFWIDADFDASYSWYGYIWHWFESLKDILHENDSMIIYPDEGWGRITYKHGKLNYKEV